MSAPAMSTDVDIDPTQVQIADAQAYAAGLRQLADLVEATPHIARTELAAVTPWYPEDRATLVALTRAARAAGGVVDRASDEKLFELRIRFGPVTAKAIAWRSDVCERVVVGTREVVETIPDPSAPPTPTVELKRTEEIVEWRCPDGRPTPTPAGGEA